MAYLDTRADDSVVALAFLFGVASTQLPGLAACVHVHCSKFADEDVSLNDSRSGQIAGLLEEIGHAITGDIGFGSVIEVDELRWRRSSLIWRDDILKGWFVNYIERSSFI